MTLSATLTDNGTSTGVPNEQITFTVGAEMLHRSDGTSGEASCSVTLGDTAGPCTAGASFSSDGVIRTAAIARGSRERRRDDDDLHRADGDSRQRFGHDPDREAGRGRNQRQRR